MKPLIPSMLAYCLLSACAAGPPPMPVQPIPVPPPPNLTAPPQPLPAPASGRIRDLETNHRQVAQAYHQLASQLCSLLAFLEVRHDECARYAAPPR